MGRHFWADGVTKMVDERFKKMESKKYKIIGKIVLSFIIDDEQHDILYDNRSYIDHILTDGKTVWIVLMDDNKVESITTPNVIDVALKNKSIEEIE
jgi:hypothetical protein